MFDELVGKAADRAAKEAKRAARAAEAFTALLRETKGITQGMPWEEAHVLVAGDRDYQAVSALSVVLQSSCHCLHPVGFQSHDSTQDVRCQAACCTPVWMGACCQVGPLAAAHTEQ